MSELSSRVKSLEAIRCVANAWRSYLAREYIPCIDEADRALLSMLREMCISSGATSASMANRGKESVPFDKWNFQEYVKFLEGNASLPRIFYEEIQKVRSTRNDARYYNRVNQHLVERSVVVTEYFVRTFTGYTDKTSELTSTRFPIVKTVSVRRVKKDELSFYINRGWQFVKETGKYATVRRRYEKHELFEIRLRSIIKALKFEDCIKDVEDFWYTELGPQVDACGGSSGVFFVFECVSKYASDTRRLEAEITELAGKKERILKKVNELYPSKYHTIRLVLCVEDIDISDHDRKLAEESGVSILDGEKVRSLFKYYQTLGVALKYHMVKSLAGFSPVIIDDTMDPCFRFPAMRFKIGDRHLYSFLASPTDLIKMCYVYRLEQSDPKGYQRELNRRKIQSINEFLSKQENFFANNIILCFDKDPEFKEEGNRQSKVSFGRLIIPKQYCSAEIIDGQHRLYGYLRTHDSGVSEGVLKRRRSEDMLLVFAVADPMEEERALLFLDINSNQTRVSPRQQWVLMARARPESLVGFVANVIIRLNEMGVFRNKIHIPGINRSRNKKINIANFGKGLIDRKLLHKREEWNLYPGDRRSKEYKEQHVDQMARKIEQFFRHFQSSRFQGFIFTNNGVNVLLRILVELLKFERIRNSKLSRHEWSIVTRSVEDVLTLEDIDEVRKSTSNEAGRATVANKILKRMKQDKTFSSLAVSL